MLISSSSSGESAIRASPVHPTRCNTAKGSWFAISTPLCDGTRCTRTPARAELQKLRRILHLQPIGPVELLVVGAVTALHSPALFSIDEFIR